jgi:hypothetical protein
MATPTLTTGAKVGIAVAVCVVVVVAVVVPVVLVYGPGGSAHKKGHGGASVATGSLVPVGGGVGTQSPAAAAVTSAGLGAVTPAGRALVAKAVAAAQKPLPAGFPIDAVFTWVSGDDPAWRALKARVYKDQYGRPYTENSRDPSRTADGKDELYYAVHTLLKFAPWMRRVWIVTAKGQRPPWLQLGDGLGAEAATRVVRGVPVTVVHHDRVFDPRCVPGPTFNSNSIEAQMPHIKGLAECVYFANDDFFVGAPLAREDLFTPTGTPVVSLRDASRQVAAMGTMWGQHLRNMQQHCKTLGIPALLPEHVAAPLRKSVHKAVVKALEPAICAAKPFRTPTDFPNWYVALTAVPVAPRRPDFRTKYFANGAAYEEYVASGQPSPHLFCINQEVTEGTKAALEALLAS